LFAYFCFRYLGLLAAVNVVSTLPFVLVTSDL